MKMRSYSCPSTSLLFFALLSAAGVPACEEGDGDPIGDGDSDGDGDTGGSSTGGTGHGNGDGDGDGGDGDGDGDTGGSSGGGTGDGDGDGDGDGSGGMGGSDPGQSKCTSVIPANDSSFSELCTVDGEVAHVRIQGLLAPATHASTQLLFGYDEAPSSTNPTTEEGQFKALFYGGGTPAPSAVVMSLFEEAEAELSGEAAFLHASSTVCFDVHHGSSGLPPHFVLWVDGQDGADCDDSSTLTLNSAFGRELWWGGQAKGSISRGRPVFFRQAADERATVSLFNEPVLQQDELLPFSCVTEIPADTSDWVDLCVTDEPAQHVKIEGLLAPATHATTQLLFGFDTAPSGSPSSLETDQFQVLFYGGGDPAPGPIVQGSFGAVVSSFTQGTAFMHSPSTVCMDVHDGTKDTPPYFVVWIDGENDAVCNDWSTLTLESAAYKELSFEGTTGAIDKTTPVFFGQTTSQAATVTVTGATALSAEPE